ncbi:MAG: type II toxin-antitoxin system RelE/ParE family toxin [Pseudomonadota bacterium]
MGYRTTRAADEDLIQAFLDGILKFGVPQAQRYREALEYVFELIVDNPRLGKRIAGRDSRRKFHHGRHVIIYCIEDGGDILIERVFHDAMDIDRHL